MMCTSAFRVGERGSRVLQGGGGVAEREGGGKTFRQSSKNEAPEVNGEQAMKEFSIGKKVKRS